MCICSVIVGQLERFRNYKGYGMIFPNILDAIFCAGNHMIPSANWINDHECNFQRLTKLSECNLWPLKILQVPIYSKFHEENHVITY